MIQIFFISVLIVSECCMNKFQFRATLNFKVIRGHSRSKIEGDGQKCQIPSISEGNQNFDDHCSTRYFFNSVHFEVINEKFWKQTACHCLAEQTMSIIFIIKIILPIIMNIQSFVSSRFGQLSAHFYEFTKWSKLRKLLKIKRILFFVKHFCFYNQR